MKGVTDLAALAGRVLLAVPFVISGYGKIAGYAGTAGYMASKGMPMVNVLLPLAILIELGGGLAVIIGWKVRSSALALIAFTVVATFVFHNFWSAPADQVMLEQIQFLKNLSMIGGLLLLVAFGPGHYATDRDRRR